MITRAFLSIKRKSNIIPLQNIKRGSMKKWVKYIILFIVAFVVMNIGLKLHHANDWKNDEVAITKLITHCATHTKTKFPEYDKTIESQTIDFIQYGKDFTDDQIPYREFYKRCISNALYNHTPKEYFKN